MILPLSKIQTGDAGLVRSYFVWYNPGHWLPRIINVAINLWNFITDKPYCPANHVGTFVWEDGTLYFFEAVEQGYIKGDAIARFASVNSTDLTIKTYNLSSIEKTRLITICNGMLDDPYNIGGLVKQGFRELTDKAFDDKGKKLLAESIAKCKNHHKIFFCSQGYAYGIFNATEHRLCIGWYIKDPYDIYFDTQSTFVK